MLDIQKLINLYNISKIEYDSKELQTMLEQLLVMKQVIDKIDDFGGNSTEETSPSKTMDSLRDKDSNAKGPSFLKEEYYRVPSVKCEVEYEA